jgi:hypothetical protein
MWSKRIAYLMPWVKHVTLQLHTNWLHESHPLIKQIFIQPLNFALARVRDLFCSLTVDRAHRKLVLVLITLVIGIDWN